MNLASNCTYILTRVQPMYTSDIEHRRIAINKSPIPMFLKIRTMYFFLLNYNVVFRKYTGVNKHHRYPRKTNKMYSLVLDTASLLH